MSTSPSSTPVLQTSGTTSRETIIVVDDDRQILHFLADTLLPHLGYRTLSANHGKKAIELIKTRRPSLMMIDLQLGEMNGLDVVREIVECGIDIPTILMTAHGSEQIVVEAFRLGVQDYLIKPIDFDTLKTAVTRALRQSRLVREKAALTAQLQEQLRWVTVLSRVGKTVTSTLNVDEVLRRIVEAGVLMTQAEEGFLALLEDQSDRLFLRAVKNIDDEKSKTMRLPVNDPLLSKVIKSGKPLREDQAAPEARIKVSTGYLVHNVLHVPILSRGKTLGVLTVVNHTRMRPFSEMHESLMLNLADYAAVALENAGLYEKAQQEIQERMRVEAALRKSEERFSLAIQGANDGLWDWDLQANTIFYSPRWKSMLGFSDNDIGDSPKEWFGRLHPADIENVRLDLSTHIKKVSPHFENEHRILHKDGTYRWMLSRGLAVWDDEGSALRIVGSTNDITLRKAAEEELLKNAFYDTLTNLPNRELFMDRLSHIIERSKSYPEEKFAVLFVDLDRFKDINDSLGHMVGDQLITAVSQTLKGNVRLTDTVARLGGDEFAVLLTDLQSEKDACTVADNIQRQFSSPFSLHGHTVFITASIGIVTSGMGYVNAEDALRDADIAMYSAKSHGRARYEIFEPSMRERIMTRVVLESWLRQSVDHKELRIYYQPIISLRTGKINGFEALVRWQHPERGLLLPGDFIPLAEETGLVISIDRWVMKEALKQLKEWQTRFASASDLHMSVNISAKHLACLDFVEYIQDCLQETGIGPQHLRLEMTESVIMEKNEYTTKVFNELRELGVEFQIDDFGTGYSSLGYLNQFPVTALKIDRSFIDTIGGLANDSKIAQTMVSLAHDLGLEAVAEGVETELQLTHLASLGCEYGQGFLVSVPLDAGRATEFLARKDR
jgi:diguanylate cyclase (GGDEF)-like protein/PAS domain S-box-containing protein